MRCLVIGLEGNTFTHCLLATKALNPFLGWVGVMLDFAVSQDTADDMPGSFVLYMALLRGNVAPSIGWFVSPHLPNIQILSVVSYLITPGGLFTELWRFFFGMILTE